MNKEPFLGVTEKEVFRKMLWQVADFSGVEVLTYSIMDTHFHILIRVPSNAFVSDEELLRRYQVLYPEPTHFSPASIPVLREELARNGPEAAEFRERLLCRMHNVSMFMKTLKQRFSTWFNHTHNRLGPVWTDRFKSVLVEGRGNPLQTMAAYIDLNAVRAGIVDDPKDYRFCGYAEAVAGSAGARRGLEKVTGSIGQKAMEQYRRMLYGKGSSPSAGCPGMHPGNAEKVLNEQAGAMRGTTFLRCRIRYFSEGIVFGTLAYVKSYAACVQSRKGRKSPVTPRQFGAENGTSLAAFEGRGTTSPV